jgi:hypothetical protein
VIAFREPFFARWGGIRRPRAHFPFKYLASKNLILKLGLRQ